MQASQFEQQIIDYYENCDVDYKLVWHLNSQMAMHYGYWEPGTSRLRDALRLMNVKMAEMAGIQSGDKVLDAGCGVGGSSIFLAQNFNCQVNGITLSSKQVAEADANAVKNGVTGLTSFQVQNFCSTNFADNSFDVVWAIESVCHAFEKQDFLREAYRVLKPGGRLIVADFFKTESRIDLWMDKWAKSWAVNDFERTELFLQKAEQSGFKNITAKNINKEITPSVNRLYYCYFPGVVCDKVLRMLGKRNAIHQENMKSTLYQYKAFKNGSWQYMLVYGEKRY